MKKLAIVLMMGAASLTANAQMNYTVQTACHPDDVKHYDTETLRARFMMPKVMAADEINLTYTLYDRLIYGGAMPVNKELKLETFRELGPDITYFLERRELGVINVGGNGVVTVNGKEYPMSRTTSMRGTRFFSTSSAIKRIWFTKKTMKKKRKAMKKYSSSSFIRYVIRT